MITFGEEGLTARKDDPRTKEFIEKKEKEIDERSIFEGVNLRGAREENETFEEYKDRQKMNKVLLKMYYNFGKE